MSLQGKYVDKNRDLIQSCRKNDRVAQIAIYQLYYKVMFNTSLRIVRNTADAEDIMQESFLEAFQKISSYKEEGSFGSWLKRIVINKSLDALKARQSRMSLGQKIMEMEAQNGEDEQDPVEMDCGLEEIRLAFQKLPENYRIVLTLFLWEGYDHQEIAQVLKIPYGNVRTRYSRARQRLIKEIQETRNSN